MGWPAACASGLSPRPSKQAPSFTRSTPRSSSRSSTASAARSPEPGRSHIVSSADLHIPFSSPGLDGGITVAHQVIAKLAGKAARATYGVVAMQESPIRKLARFFRGALTEGVEVDIKDGAANILSLIHISEPTRRT